MIFFHPSARVLNPTNRSVSGCIMVIVLSKAWAKQSGNVTKDGRSASMFVITSHPYDAFSNIEFIKLYKTDKM